jgi:hypothetical protein
VLRAFSSGKLKNLLFYKVTNHMRDGKQSGSMLEDAGRLYRRKEADLSLRDRGGWDSIKILVALRFPKGDVSRSLLGKGGKMRVLPLGKGSMGYFDACA